MPEAVSFRTRSILLLKLAPLAPIRFVVRPDTCVGFSPVLATDSFADANYCDRILTHNTPHSAILQFPSQGNFLATTLLKKLRMYQLGNMLSSSRRDRRPRYYHYANSSSVHHNVTKENTGKVFSQKNFQSFFANRGLYRQRSGTKTRTNPT